MNYSSYLMRDQAYGLVSSLDQVAQSRKQRARMRRLRSLAEIAAFVAAVASYLIALSLMA